ncbi:MAG: glutaredoxin family protein [Motilibacteraceae bacterium]
MGFLRRGSEPRATAADVGTGHVVTLVGKPGCHLCEQAREVVLRVADELGASVQERSILDDPELYDAYWEKIPVTLVDGVPHDYWRVDERRLRAALGG